jgi:hypothetical protein
MNPQLLQPGRLGNHVFCDSAAMKFSWDVVGDLLKVFIFTLRVLPNPLSLPFLCT